MLVYFAGVIFFFRFIDRRLALMTAKMCSVCVCEPALLFKRDKNMQQAPQRTVDAWFW